MAQRECKKCHRVKPERKFFAYYETITISHARTITTWLCKSCAENIAFEAQMKEAKKYNPKNQAKQ